MKKFPALAASLLLSLTLAACGGGGSSDSGSTSASSTASSARSSAAATSSGSSAAASASSLATSSSSSTSSGATTAGVTIHMLGDSTMTTYTEDRRPQAGWGEKIGLFFNSNVTIKNWAAGGRSSRSFYYETGMWPDAKAAIKSGDYVIIQFGHNDQKYGTTDSTGPYSTYGTYAICSDPAITDGENCSGGTDVVDSTTPLEEHSYYQFLKRYVSEIRAKGGIPILATPMVRLDMSSGSVTAAGQHDYSSTIKGTESNPRGNYPTAMKAVAAKYSVPLIDITAETKTIVESFGKEAATASLYVSGDSTHPQIMFAALIAKKATEGMKAISSLSALSAYMSTTSTTILSPTSLAFSGVTVNSGSTKSVAVVAFGLNPAAGNLNLSAPTDFQLSADQSSWGQTLDVAYSGGEVTKLIYVRFAPTVEQAYSSSVTAALAGSTVGSVAVSGTGTAALTDYAQWFLNTTDTTASVTGGRLTAALATASNLSSTSALSTTLDSQAVTAARYVVDTWIAADATKYVQFSITPSVALNVTTISMYYASSGGSNLRANIEYSLSADFSNPVRLNSADLISAKDALTLAKYNVSLPLASGATIYVRVFPWQKTATTNKSMALYNVTIGGIAQ